MELPHVGFDLGGHAERPCEDVTLRVDRRLGLGHLALAHRAPRPGCGRRSPGRSGLGEHVGPGVADVGQGQHVLPSSPPTRATAVSVVPMPRRSSSATLSRQTAVLASAKAARRPVGGRGALEGLLQRLHRDAGGHLAPHVTPMPSATANKLAARVACPG